MIVVIAPGTSEALIKEVETHILDWGYEVHPIYGSERTVIAAVGVPEQDKAGRKEALAFCPNLALILPQFTAAFEFWARLCLV